MCNYGSIPDIKLLIGSPALMILLMEPMQEPMQFYLFQIPPCVPSVIGSRIFHPFYKVVSGILPHSFLSPLLISYTPLLYPCLSRIYINMPGPGKATKKAATARCKPVKSLSMVLDSKDEDISSVPR